MTSTSSASICCSVEALRGLRFNARHFDDRAILLRGGAGPVSSEAKLGESNSLTRQLNMFGLDTALRV